MGRTPIEEAPASEVRFTSNRDIVRALNGPWPNLGVNKFLRITGVSACFLALLVMTGGHWFALQSFAWVRMTLEFSHNDTLRGALARTFSGRYPCALCLKVKKGWQQQQDQERRSPWLGADKMPEMVWTFRLLKAPLAVQLPAPAGVFSSQFFYDFSESPPTPPPRG